MKLFKAIFISGICSALLFVNTFAAHLEGQETGQSTGTFPFSSDDLIAAWWKIVLVLVVLGCLCGALSCWLHARKNKRNKKNFLVKEKGKNA